MFFRALARAAALPLAARLPRGGAVASLARPATTTVATGRRHPPRHPPPRALRDAPPFDVAPGDDSDWVGETASDSEEAE
jgi:hypothetical protein